MPLVIHPLGGGHTHIHTHTHARILTSWITGQHAPGLKSSGMLKKNTLGVKKVQDQ